MSRHTLQDAMARCRECGKPAGMDRGYLCQPCAATARRRNRATSDGVQRYEPGRVGMLPKLSPDDIARVKRMHAGLKSNVAIAREFGCDAKTIARVLAGKYPGRADA